MRESITEADVVIIIQRALEKHGGRIHCVDLYLEAPQQTLALAPSCEIRTGVLEVTAYCPEQLTGKIRVTVLVGVGGPFLDWVLTPKRASTPDLRRIQSRKPLRPMA